MQGEIIIKTNKTNKIVENIKINDILFDKSKKIKASVTFEHFL